MNLKQITMNEKKVGAPKRYEERILISHSIELSLLKKLDDAAELGETRTDLINKAIKTYLKLKSK